MIKATKWKPPWIENKLFGDFLLILLKFYRWERNSSRFSLENFTTREFPSDKQLISVLFYEDSKFVNSWFHGSRLVSDTQYMSGFFNKRNSKLKKYHVRLFPISRVGSTVEFMNCGASWVRNSQSGLSPHWCNLTRSRPLIIPEKYWKIF